MGQALAAAAAVHKQEVCPTIWTSVIWLVIRHGLLVSQNQCHFHTLSGLAEEVEENVAGKTI